MQDLVICDRCGSNACMENKINENLTTLFCFGCGFTTSTELIQGSDEIKGILDGAPELYKDLLFVDKKGRVWFPSTVTLPEKGMVFLDGTDKDNWTWSAVKAVEITEEERSKFPSGQKYKMDVKGAKKFGKRDFMDALETIGFFSVDL